MDQKHRVNQVPRITATQWVLALLSLALAGIGYFASSYESLISLSAVQTGVSITLLVVVGTEMLRTRVLGKLLLVASTLFFFWLEALSLAHESPPFLVPFNASGASGQFAQDLVQQAYLYVALFQFALLVGYSIRPKTRRIVAWVGSRVDASSRRTQLLRYGLAACALVPLLLSYKLDVGDIVEALVASRSGAGPESQDIGLWYYLYFFGVYGSAVLMAQALLFRGTSRIRTFVIGGIAAVPFVMLWGARHLWLFVALPVLILAVARLQRRITVSQAIRWAVAVLVLLMVAQLQLLLRQIGWNEIGSLTLADLFQGADTGQFRALLFAEYLVPDIHDYFHEFAEPHFIFHWIPRRFWPDKPIMESWAFYNQAYAEGQAFNVTPSVIGQYHLNWGIFGVVYIGLWLGFLTFLADRMLRAIDVDRQQAMAVTIGMLYAFIISSFRFFSPVYFTYFVFGFAAMLLLTRGHRRVEVADANEARTLQAPSLP